MNQAAWLRVYDRVAAKVLDRLRDPLLLLVRVLWGWQFFVTGKGKLGNLERTTEFFASLGLPLPGFNALFVGLVECVGGLLLLTGTCSRPAALLLSVNMLVAYLTAHTDQLGSIDGFTGAPPYPYLQAALLVLAFGPGWLAADTLLRRFLARSARDDGKEMQA